MLISGEAMSYRQLSNMCKIQLNYGLFVNYNQYTEFYLVNRMTLQEFEIAGIFQIKGI